MYSNTIIFAQTNNLDSIITQMLDTFREGIIWGNTVAIGVTASLLAIGLIQFLFNRN